MSAKLKVNGSSEPAAPEPAAPESAAVPEPSPPPKTEEAKPKVR